MNHYFTDNRHLAQNRKEITFRFSCFTCHFLTDNGVFCKDHVDFGTRTLLDAVHASGLLGEEVLDLGCGYGVIGITLKKQYPDAYFDLPAAFQCVDQATDFPAMSKLLFEIENYRGEGVAASLFYEAKVTEAVALVVDNQKKQTAKNAHPLSKEDIAGLRDVISYIADHYTYDIPLERLASIACMSASKLKTCFKRHTGCTVTEYIQGRRMSQAEHLLIDTDFTMGQIAQMIGYSTSSRFAELFKKNTGILPIEYRKIARKDQ